VRALAAVGLLWTLMAPSPRGTFESAAGCQAEAAAWAARTREGAQWIARRQQEALQQTNQAVTAFWFKSERMAAGQVEQARAARCVEVKS
jgi:hypothetical protein